MRTPEQFQGTRTKGSYPESSRVQFTLPGKDDKPKIIEILWSGKANPSFGAVKVKLPLDAGITSKDARLVVKGIKQGSNAELSKIRRGDIIRAVSLPETENSQVDSPWWASLSRVVVPDAEEGMVILDGKSPATFAAAVQENLRVNGKNAEVVLIIERPFQMANDDDDRSFFGGFPSFPSWGQVQGELAPELVPIPVPVDEDPLSPRSPPAPGPGDYPESLR